ncbi:hypothetical protein LINGRAHAP2_LOCUS12178, partial [Linum grandiflorum]
FSSDSVVSPKCIRGLRLPRSKPAAAATSAGSTRFDVVSRRKEGDSFTRGSPTTPLYEFLGLKRFRIYSRRHCRPTARPYVSCANHSEKQAEPLPILNLTDARVVYSVAPAMGHNQEAHPESHFRRNLFPVNEESFSASIIATWLVGLVGLVGHNRM